MTLQAGSVFWIFHTSSGNYISLNPWSDPAKRRTFRVLVIVLCNQYVPYTHV